MVVRMLTRSWCSAPVAGILRGGVALLAVLAGCFHPVVREGAPCETTLQCPDPQRCVLGTCSLHDPPPVDATPPPDAAIDAPPPPIDALVLPCGIAGLSCAGGMTTMFSCGGKCWVRCTASVVRETARAACAGWMGALGQIDDATENGCVQAKVAAPTWIGLLQSDTATAPAMGWTWNGVPLMNYTHWVPAEPDDADTIENRQEQCADIGIDGQWDDNACSVPLQFMCERPQP